MAKDRIKSILVISEVKRAMIRSDNFVAVSNEFVHFGIVRAVKSVNRRCRRAVDARSGTVCDIDVGGWICGGCWWFGEGGFELSSFCFEFGEFGGERCRCEVLV